MKSGSRNVSPLFNGLELSANFLNGGLLRPVYADSSKTLTLADGTIVPFTTNMFTTPIFQNVNQLRAGFCLGCHNGPLMKASDSDPTLREVPELAGTGANFVPETLRPLRDYHMVDSNGNQILPASIGGDPPPGSGPSLGAAGITCDMCHNLQGPDLNRSVQGDGFANNSIDYNHTIEKVGPFGQSRRRDFSTSPATTLTRSLSCAVRRFAMLVTMSAFRWRLPVICNIRSTTSIPGTRV